MKSARNLALLEGGQSLAEFALVFPIFLLVIVALFDIGRGVFAYNSVTNAAREGARLAIVNQDNNKVAQRALEQTSVADADAANVHIDFRASAPDDDPLNNAMCGSPVSVGCVVIVTYSTTFTPITPIIRQILFPAGVTLTATTILPVEFTCPNATLTSVDCPKQP